MRFVKVPEVPAFNDFFKIYPAVMWIFGYRLEDINFICSSKK